MIPTNRIASIDILRALTMTLMIFVNDLWSLQSIPEWLEHTAADEDGMGLADTVFPAFLFITGMSIPLAVSYRRSKGDGNNKIMSHILLRAIALLTMGLFLVNGEYLNESATGMTRGVWNSICCTCFILLWNSWPANMNRFLNGVLKGVAVIALLILAWIYRGGEGDSISRFSTYWWGILGLIGWAYLVTSITFTLSKGRVLALTLVWAGFILTCMASHAGLLSSFTLFNILLSPLGDGAMPAFVCGGTLTTLTFLHFKEKNKHSTMIYVLLGLGVVLLAIGFYTRTFWGISKIRATPAWVLICSAITIFTFVLIYWLTDLKGKTKWFSVLEPAGTNTLLCYLLPYFAYGIIFTIGVSLPDALLTGYAGLLKSLVFSLLIVISAGLLLRVGVRLKL